MAVCAEIRSFFVLQVFILKDLSKNFEEKFLKLKNAYPTIIGHKTQNNQVKLAAGWLIE
jgi:hypothetical protein